MIFDAHVFAPQRIHDRTAREILCRATEHAGEIIRPGDLLAAAVIQGNPSLQRLFASHLRSGSGTADLAATARVQPQGPGGAARVRTRASFSPAALEALDAFDLACQADAADGAGSDAELLLACVLPRLDEQERRQWAELDIAATLAELQRRLGLDGPGCPDARQAAEMDNGGLLAALAEIAPAEDLSRHARLLEAAPPGPFEGESVYEQLFDRMARILHRSETHAILVGERGVGQTTILAELARRVAGGRLAALRGRRIVLVDCRHTSPESSGQRLMGILRAAAGEANLVVCLDGFALLVRAERGGTNRAALLGVLPRLRCKLVGLLSPRDYEELVADDADMRERFVAVEAPEPEVETAVPMLGYYAGGLEQQYAVRIEPEAIREAVVLTDRYVLHERLPGKAIKVLREICEDIAYERAEAGCGQGHRSLGEREGDRSMFSANVPRDEMREEAEKWTSPQPPSAITAEHVVRAVARLSGVPEETLRGVAERGDYELSLGREILGQEHAVREVARELGLIKAGLTDAGKPASVMLFVGQTGTGKTEMAKTLARFYSRSKRLRTYTLGNFCEPHSVAGIIGVPPGYVGHEQGGRIVADLAADPYCVFLLDEADKAHPDVLQPFLNLFDEGWICDQRGVKAYADKAIFILTTNVGQRMLADMAKQGKSPEEMASRMKEALAQIRHGKSNRPVFAPEFLARIKRVIVFQPLTQEAMEGICRKLLDEMQEVWREKRQKELVVAEGLVEWIAAESHRRNEKSQGREGGRIVRKLMAQWIETPVQQAATAEPGKYRQCGVVEVEARIGEEEPEVGVRFGKDGSKVV